MADGDTLHAPVLVLNRVFQPIRMTTVRHAFVAVYSGTARALDDGYELYDFDAWVRIAPRDGETLIGTLRGPIRAPRVICLVTYARVPRTSVRLSRQNVFLRDQYVCQYCGVSPPIRDLNLDHVLPRSRGGKSSWENLVTSCRPCNLRKGRALPDECGMALRSTPKRPTWTAAMQLATAPVRFPEWEPFLVGAGVPPARRDGDSEAA